MINGRNRNETAGNNVTHLPSSWTSALISDLIFSNPPETHPRALLVPMKAIAICGKDQENEFATHRPPTGSSWSPAGQSLSCSIIHN